MTSVQTSTPFSTSVITVGSLVRRAGTTDPRGCGEVSRDNGDTVCIAWAFGGESDPLPRAAFHRITEPGLKREIARMMISGVGANE